METSIEGEAAQGRPRSAEVTVTATTVAVDKEYEQVVKRASWMGSHGRDKEGKGPLVSFPSLVLALGGGGSETLDWFKATLRELQPKWVGRVYFGWKNQTASPSTFPPDLTVDHVRRPPALDADLPAADDRTPSAVAIEKHAAELATKTGGSPGVRHLLVATLLAHEADYTAWQIPRRSLLARYLAILARDHPSELTAWNDAIRGAYIWDKSARFKASLAIAGLLATRRSATVIEVGDLLDALLIEGAKRRGEKVADAWLVAQLPPDRVEALPDVPTGADPGLPMAPPVESWLDVARRYALCGTLDHLNTRHVIAALLSPAGPGAGKQRLRKLGGDPTELARAFLALMLDARPGEDLATWEWLLANDAPPPELRKPRYTNDHADGADLIGIQTDVRALASVLAAKDTRAPLSVGLFGDWGSGKSFFMRKMQEHIAKLESESSRSTNGSVFCKSIAQIELNAWHYMDNDVWSSMVVHLLEELDRRFVRDETKANEAQAKESLAFVDLQRAHAQRELEAARARVEGFDARLAVPVSAKEIESGVLRTLGAETTQYLAGRPEVKAAIAAFESNLGLAPGSMTVPALEEAHAKALSWSGQVASWWRDTRRNPASIALLLACATIPIALAVVGSIADQVLPRLLAAATAIAGVVGAIASIAAKAKPVIDAGRRALAAAKTAANGVMTDARKDLLAERSNAERERMEIERRLAELDAKAADLQRALQPKQRSSFRDYVLERARSPEYRDRQGIVALVNRDFQGLSVRLRDDKSAPKVDRIILYIDDLDRCTPERVVEVLQAIHLMLSFELFIVVVAVDSSWLLESLKAYYTRQFPGVAHDAAEWSMRPQFYLEKIFQLPYTLHPLDDTGFKRLVGGLLSDEIDLDLDEAGTGTPSGDSGGATPAIAGRAPILPIGPQAVGAPPPLDLSPRNLEITQAELTYMQLLGPLVPSPRAGKRLVNLYRIVRAGLHGDALAWFIDDHYQMTQVFLAAVVGVPSETAAWFEQILDGRLKDAKALRGELERRGKTDAQFALLHEKLVACRDLEDWPRVVRTCREAARYSFETGRLLASPRS